MGIFDDIAQPHLGIIEVDGKRYNVSCHIAFDGIEYVGRLWFADESWDDVGTPDRQASLNAGGLVRPPPPGEGRGRGAPRVTPP